MGGRDYYEVPRLQSFDIEGIKIELEGVQSFIFLETG